MVLSLNFKDSMYIIVSILFHFKFYILSQLLNNLLFRNTLELNLEHLIKLI